MDVIEIGANKAAIRIAQAVNAGIREAGVGNSDWCDANVIAMFAKTIIAEVYRAARETPDDEPCQCSGGFNPECGAHDEPDDWVGDNR